MTSERKLQDSIMAHALGVESCELPPVSRSMQELHDIQVERLQRALNEANMQLALVRGLARDKDRGRRRQISTLYMALWGAALVVAYFAVKG